MIIFALLKLFKKQLKILSTKSEILNNTKIQMIKYSKKK